MLTAKKIQSQWLNFELIDRDLAYNTFRVLRVNSWNVNYFMNLLKDE
jgi:hypothetical protein